VPSLFHAEGLFLCPSWRTHRHGLFTPPSHTQLRLRAFVAAKQNGSHATEAANSQRRQRLRVESYSGVSRCSTWGRRPGQAGLESWRRAERRLLGLRPGIPMCRVSPSLRPLSSKAFRCFSALSLIAPSPSSCARQGFGVAPLVTCQFGATCAGRLAALLPCWMMRGFSGFSGFSGFGGFTAESQWLGKAPWTGSVVVPRAMTDIN
jgi:hypothetical protein